MDKTLAVLVPTRGRPSNARRLWQACRDTAADVVVWCGVDVDDPEIGGYLELAGEMPSGSVVPMPPSPDGMVSALNLLARRAVKEGFQAVGFMGDDHLPTGAWAQHMMRELEHCGPGIVYGDDGIHGAGLPTACVMSSEIPRALGFMAPECLGHLYVDNFWLDLGKALGCLHYLPDVIIKHLHPLVGAAPEDDGYRRVNSPQRYEADRRAYEHYKAERFGVDVARVRTVLDRG